LPNICVHHPISLSTQTQPNTNWTQAFAALPPGGAFIALDLIIDDERRSNRWGLYMSLSMLTEFNSESAFDYSFEDFQGWAQEVGFSRSELIRLGGAASAAVAYKCDASV
jgi:hypothetical protein